ncbi:hypothetical protein GGS20DRAFT_583942 [Poronia punctata]|nr:hypothetical protein GGS20DRAFT_583942 [Poronia punctata]
MFAPTEDPASLPRAPAPKVDGTSQPWTTARCHRLLRPLISRIATLRKDTLANIQPANSVPRLPSGPASISSTGNGGSCPVSEAEPEWMAPKKKRPRLRYSQRRSNDRTTAQNGQGSSDERERTARGTKPIVKRAFKNILSGGLQSNASPGEIIAATPLLRRARGDNVPSPVAPMPKLDLGANQPGINRGLRTKTVAGAQRRLDERLSGLREHLPSNYTELEGIYRSFEALLKATAPGSVATKGPRTLLEMCLRKVPQYIIQLEAWERLEAEQSGTISTLDGIDTSAQIYNDLESLGTNLGWRHLRVVVRADGLGAVRRGIEDGIFSDEFSQLIIELCVQLEAYSEAEELVIALVSRQYPHPTSTESRFAPATSLQPLIVLNRFVDRTQRTPFLFRQYTRLLESGDLPAEWLATSEFERIWNLAVQAIAKNKPSSDAMNFIVESIALLSIRKRATNTMVDAAQPDQAMAKASQRTLISVLAILASMALLGEDELDSGSLPASDNQRIIIVGGRIRHVIRACLYTVKPHRRGAAPRRLEFLYLALFLSSSPKPDGHTRNHSGMVAEKISSAIKMSLSGTDTRMRHHYDGIAWLIASIARDYSRGTSTTTHKCLDKLFERLGSLQLGKHLLDDLKAATAFQVAQQTNNVRDLIYAEKLHLHDQTSSAPANEGRNGSTFFTGYRWEDTIGEWVMASPDSNKRRHTTTLKRHTRSSTIIPNEEDDDTTTSTTATTSSHVITGRLGDADTGQDSIVPPQNNQIHTDEEEHTAAVEKTSLMRKRPRRFRSQEILSTGTPISQKKSLTRISSLKIQRDELDADKENRTHWLAKKPRRSSGRMVLGPRPPQSRYSLGAREKPGPDGLFSDDELCL